MWFICCLYVEIVNTIGDTEKGRHASMASDGGIVPWGVVPSREGENDQEGSFAAIK